MREIQWIIQIEPKDTPNVEDLCLFKTRFLRSMNYLMPDQLLVHQLSYQIGYNSAVNGAKAKLL